MTRGSHMSDGPDPQVSGPAEVLAFVRGGCGGPVPHYLVESIEHVARVLARPFRFGYFDRDDIMQEVRKFCWEALQSYDGERCLKNFFYAHSRNRLLNLHRDKRMRNDPPCSSCHDGKPCQPDGHMCAKYAKWFQLNSTKASLVQPGTWTDGVAARHLDKSTTSPLDTLCAEEVMGKLDEHIPLELRADFLKIKEGVFVPPARYEAVVNACREALGLDEEEGTEGEVDGGDEDGG